MSAGAATRQRPLPAGIAREELAEWCPRIALPLAVTGGAGFVGSHVVAALIEGGVRPRLLLRDPSRLPEHLRAGSEVVRGDLDDQGALARLVGGCGTAIHLAGVVRAQGEARFDRTNRVGTQNLVAALAEGAPAARLVHVSSLAAAGPSTEPAGRPPDAEPHPISAYGRSKLGGEVAARRHGGPWTILRPPAVYGPRDIDVLQFFRMAARGLVPIPSGERWVTVAYVADVARAVLASAAGNAERRVLHLGEPSPRTVAGFVAEIAAAGGVNARIVPVPGGVVRLLGLGGDLLQWLGLRSVALTSDKARELLGRHWSAQTEGSLAALGLAGCVPLAAGATETWAWYRRHGWVKPRAKMRPA